MQCGYQSVALLAPQEYSNWPTYPQLYVDGELVGGCDIIEQLAEAGELGATLEGAS